MGKVDVGRLLTFPREKSYCHDMSPHPTSVIYVNGERLEATPSGALWWPERRALLVADLHFEKGSSFAGRGVLLPPYDTRATLKRLAAVKEAFAPRIMVSLGDAFHDVDAEARLDPEDASLLDHVMHGVQWVWITGNHDPLPPARFSGEVAADLSLGALRLVHEPSAGPADGEIAGHLHPCAKVVTSGRRVRRRCFATDGKRLILPAFGAYTGGLNVLDSAYDQIFGHDLTAWVAGAKGVYPFGRGKLVPDMPSFGGAVSTNSRKAS